MNKNKLNEIELEYSKKLKQAKIEENHDKMIMLFWELKNLRKFYKKT